MDFVLTDPPYLVNYRDRQGRSLAGDNTGQWLKPAFAEIFRVLKPGRFCVSFYGWKRWTSSSPPGGRQAFRPVGHLVWVKRYASSEAFWPTSTSRPICWPRATAAHGRAPLPDVLDWQYTGNRLHPTQKPVPSLKPVIEAFTRPGEVVLDPFCGSGSTLLAAKILGRRYIGIELDAEYAKTARGRL